MEVYWCLNEGIFVTVTVELKEELWSASRGNTDAETLGNAWQGKGVITSATKHCASRNAHDAPKQDKFLEH